MHQDNQTSVHVQWKTVELYEVEETNFQSIIGAINNSIDVDEMLNDNVSHESSEFINS